MESDKKKKTYKREVSLAIMAFEFLLLSGAALVDDAEYSQRLLGIAKYLMPFAAAMLSGAFGADWWSKQEVKK